MDVDKTSLKTRNNCWEANSERKIPAVVPDPDSCHYHLCNDIDKNGGIFSDITLSRRVGYHDFTQFLLYGSYFDVGHVA